MKMPVCWVKMDENTGLDDKGFCELEVVYANSRRRKQASNEPKKPKWLVQRNCSACAKMLL